MKKYYETAVLTAISGALVIGALLYLKSRPVDGAAHYSVTQTLTQLHEVDARWDADVLRSKLSINTNYDPLIESTMALQTLEQELAQAVRRAAPDDAALLDGLAQYEAAFEQKIDAVEFFKSQNAILRNSVFFIATGFDEAHAAIDDALADGGEMTPVLSALKTRLQSLRGLFLAYTTQGKESTMNEISDELARIDETLARLGQDRLLPDAVNTPLAIVLNHARTLLRQKPVVDELLAEIAATPTAEQLNRLQKLYFQSHQRRLAQADRYRQLLWLFVGALAFFAAYVYLRARGRRQMRELAKMNQTLEQRVTARTAELSGAYEELKQSQTRLIQSEKMSALGQMVAGVAHEINTPLAYCSSNVVMVREQLAEVGALVEVGAELARLLDQPKTETGEVADADTFNLRLAQIAELAGEAQRAELVGELDELLGDSNAALGEISEMVMNLKNFSRVDRKKTDSVNLNDCLDSSLMIARNNLKHKIEVVKQYGELPAVSCAPSQLNQVFLNMLVNASQAIEERGTITLTTSVVGDRVEIVIADDGPGIPEDVLPHVFDPFYTTKEVGEGTGLGLSICYQIIEQHDGTISVDSAPGRGTRFTVSLPAKAAAKTRRVADEAAA